MKSNTKSDAQKKRIVSARELAMDILTRVEQEGAYSNILLNQSLQKLQLDRVEAGFATELVYGTIQRLNTIDYYLGQFVAKGMAKLAPWVRNLLRLSFYQIYYLDRIPPHAAVNEAVNLAKRKGHQGISGMVNGVLRNVLRQKETLQLPTNLSPTEHIALMHSHPEWMVKQWVEQYGEEATVAMCAANNEAPRVSIRVNRMKHERAELIDQLAAASVEARPSELAPSGVIVTSGGNMALTDWFQQGDISIQDESSMLVAEALNPANGMRVLDCCAAPGGKTAHVAELMNDTGEIHANDVHPHKQKLIADQAARLGLSSIRTKVSDALTLSQSFQPASFDRILLDAPCSGLGVIRRKPDLKWAKNPHEIQEIAALQAQLLNEVHTLLKPGGILVYSTCTVAPEENIQMVEQFLAKHPEFDWAPDETASTAWKKVCQHAGQVEEIALRHQQLPGSSTSRLQLLPQDYHSDGFFIARLIRL